ncbi:helix-turn-helix domain-containing protein [Roseivivax sp. GX 12232]|uniref:helix-turn-helix domain-containing protein n=1 Tax=Roseivivax sp. GX 12232 TaxID=2900547 RepID=UPI001E549A69|nr:helix-turn-helix transcriptional regulator [Roseivivax sp. GX 12232]MCE0507151.1 helix-turn-helix domain-containing protein [Roseivivax sp. GX 12232]
MRARFGRNLRELSSRAHSISALCRELGINRTQYNRYLSGESFPRPDILHRICTHFGTDARILLCDVSEIEAERRELSALAEVAGFVGAAERRGPSEGELPSGFYRFSRRSYITEELFLTAVVKIYRAAGRVFVRGYEHRRIAREKGLPVDRYTREYRGAVLPQSHGIAALVSRRGGETASLNFLTRAPSLANNFWVGFTARTAAESGTGRLIERLVFEYLGSGVADVLPAAREAGLRDFAELPPIHRQQLRINDPIS